MQLAVWGAAGGGPGRLGPLLWCVASVYGLYTLVRVYRQQQRRRLRRQRWDAAGHNVVVLHQFGRATVSPNLSPFAVKLETFLRMAGVQYRVDDSVPLGPKGKCPWITINGRDVTDSELIIAHLLALFPDALPARRALTDAQRATARALQTTLDEHLVVAVAAHRYHIDQLRHLVPMMSARYRRKFALLRPLAAWEAARRLRLIGWAGRDERQLLQLVRRDLRAAAALLADRPYICGHQPTEFDAGLFGHLTQLVTGCAPELVAVAAEFPTLIAYFERMKERFWPDWNQCLSP